MPHSAQCLAHPIERHDATFDLLWHLEDIKDDTSILGLICALLLRNQITGFTIMASSRDQGMA